MDTTTAPDTTALADHLIRLTIVDRHQFTITTTTPGTYTITLAWHAPDALADLAWALTTLRRATTLTIDPDAHTITVTHH